MLQFLKKVWNWLTADSNSQTKINGNIISEKGSTIRVGPGGSVNGLKIIGPKNTISIRDDQSSFEINQSDPSFFCSHEEISENSRLYIIKGDGSGSFGQLFTFSGNIDARFTIKQVLRGHIIKGSVKVSRGVRSRSYFNFNKLHFVNLDCANLKMQGLVTLNNFLTGF